MVVIVRQLIKHMSNDPDVIPAVMKIMWAVRSLERLGDRCQNIAEHIIYMVLGMDVRHECRYYHWQVNRGV